MMVDLTHLKFSDAANLTEKMQRALLQVGLGVTSCGDGYYDESADRVDMRSLEALYTRELIFYHTTGGAPMRGVIDLMAKGWEIFLDIRHSLAQSGTKTSGGM